MKTKYRYILILVILVAFPSFQLVALSTADTIKAIPFTENWDSATFTADNWRFPYSQGNWAIITNSGNPSPCATFSGLPSTSNYINVLVSPWFDARGLTCDDFSLGFDLKLSSLVNSGSEKLCVILEYDSTSYTINTWENDAGFDWKSFHFNISLAYNKLFRIRFVAYGQFSDQISGWFLDNISVTKQCRGPHNPNLAPSGKCNGIYTCYLDVSWIPPVCNGQTYNTIFSYDDGSAEMGWRMYSHPGWLGNEFPLNAGIQGVMTNVSVYFGFDPPGADSLTVDFFDENHTLIGSSQNFISPNDAWLDIPLPNLAFLGKFYAMVRWTNLTVPSNYLGYDYDGPYSADDLEWYFDGTVWSKIWQTLGVGNPPGVFQIRVSAIVSSKKEKIKLFPGRIPVISGDKMKGNDNETPQFSIPATAIQKKFNINITPDSVQITGYLVYRKQIYWFPDSAFLLLTPIPISGNSYMDTVMCSAKYYIRAVFSNGCISDPSDTIEGHCYDAFGLAENGEKTNITIAPSFASDFTEVRSDVDIRKIDVIDLNGSLIKSLPCNRSKHFRFSVGDLKSGIYLVSIELENGVAVKKLVVSH